MSFKMILSVSHFFQLTLYFISTLLVFRDLSRLRQTLFRCSCPHTSSCFLLFCSDLMETFRLELRDLYVSVQWSRILYVVPSIWCCSRTRYALLLLLLLLQKLPRDEISTIDLRLIIGFRISILDCCCRGRMISWRTKEIRSWIEHGL